MSKIIIITWDGVRPDALKQANTTWLDSVKSKGSFCGNGRTVFPSNTQPCHTSLFYGSDPSIHKVYNNFDYPSLKGYKTLFDLAYDNNLHTGSYIGWFPMKNVYGHSGKLTSLSYYQCSYGLDCSIIEDQKKINDIYYSKGIDYINFYKPDILHFYMEYPDMIGHKYGWMSEKYIESISVVDFYTKQLMAGISDQYTLFLTTDHGGHEFNHGTDLDEDMNIWMFAMGKYIKKNHIFDNFNIIDIAPTIGKIFQFPYQKEWKGKILDILEI